MPKSKVLFLLCVMLLSSALSAAADQYDDCITGCSPPVVPCIEQARLTAGNIQEEQDAIAACEKNKADCLQACKSAETTPTAPPPPKEEPLKDQPDGDSHNGIKTYEFK